MVKPCRNKVPIEDNDIQTSCANLFASILESHAKGNAKSNPATKDTSFDDSKTEVVSSNDSSGGSRIHIEDKYKKCIFCIMWDDDKNHSDKKPKGVNGTCTMCKEKRLAISGKNCKDYEPNKGVITTHRLSVK